MRVCVLGHFSLVGLFFDSMDCRLPGPSVHRIFPGKNTRASSPGEGNGNSLEYSCLENPMDGGAWWAIVHGVAKSRA